VAGEQVLVCPDCKVPGWTDGLDACVSCGSTMLLKQLGVVSCRACGREQVLSGADGARRDGGPAAEADPALTGEVVAALERVLGRAPGQSLEG
jgi:hypothetical protein